VGNGQPDVASVSVAPNGPAAIGFVGDEPVGLEPGLAGTRPVERHWVHQRQEHGRIVLVTGSQR